MEDRPNFEASIFPVSQEIPIFYESSPRQSHPIQFTSSLTLPAFYAYPE